MTFWLSKGICPVRYFGSVILLFALSHRALAQVTPQPTTLPGLTAVAFTDYSYVFTAAGGVRYIYSLADGEPARGTLHSLTVTSGANSFWPSNYGGVKALLAGKVRNPIDREPAVHHTLISSGFVDNNTVRASWSMSVGNDSCQYSYTFHLEGQTLVIDIKGDESRKATGIDFSNAFPSEGMYVISIPFLTLTNVLYNSQCNVFATLFVDWENSNASGITAWVDAVKSTGYYSEHVEYEPLTNGQRNLLSERAYLSVSSDLHDVLPNIVPPPTSPVAPMRDSLLSRMVVSYFPPFPQLNFPGSYLDNLYFTCGVRDVAFLVKNWNCGQFDHNYPHIWPPDDFLLNSCYGTYQPGKGGIHGLRTLDSNLAGKGYLFGLHENYTDYYDHRSTRCTQTSDTSFGHGLLPERRNAQTFKRSRCPCCDFDERSFLLKPSGAARVAAMAESDVKDGLSPGRPPGWCYLDVSSSVNPSGPVVNQYLESPPNPYRSYVDFDSLLGSDAGKFTATVRAYRDLASAVRRSYGGPVQGEGGNHMLYAGYFDGFEGRLLSGAGYVYGYKAPLILEFGQKIRNKSAIHGVGHIQWFFGAPEGAMNDTITATKVKIYMATELAYGHGGLVTTNSNRNLWEHSLTHAQWEERYLLWVQKMYADAEPVSVTYFDASGGHSASDYIRAHAGSYDQLSDSVNFMGRVHVAYSNGVEVWVNRSKGHWIAGPVGASTGWYCYDALIRGRDSMSVGAQTSRYFSLPPEYGWVCYSPKRPG